jgi:hypothetical protein
MTPREDSGYRGPLYYTPYPPFLVSTGIKDTHSDFLFYNKTLMGMKLITMSLNVTSII